MTKKQINWPRILVQCENNVREQITPLLRTQDQSQPELGIGAGGDPLRKIDLAAERAVIDTLTGHKISFVLVSEESGVRKIGPPPHNHFVTVDPIDGTTNLTRGIPFYATSIAVSSKAMINAVHTALVTDLAHNITYTAQDGNGAYRNNEEITPSKIESLGEAVVGIDLCTHEAKEMTTRLAALVRKVKHIRHLGANALELCHVADGTTEAFLDVRGKLRTTDMAAAWLIIKEAGAKITTPEGRSLNIKLSPKQKASFVAAANQKIHEIILGLMKNSKGN